MLDFRQLPVGDGLGEYIIDAQGLPLLGDRLIQKAERPDDFGARIAFRQRRRVVLFREFIAVAIESQRQMEVIRRLPAKMLIQRNLPHRRLNQVCAADNLGDPLKVVVDHHRQVVGEQPVATVDNKILTRQRLIGDERAAQTVAKLQHRTGLAQAQRGVFRPSPRSRQWPS